MVRIYGYLMQPGSIFDLVFDERPLGVWIGAYRLMFDHINDRDRLQGSCSTPRAHTHTHTYTDTFSSTATPSSDDQSGAQ